MLGFVAVLAAFRQLWRVDLPLLAALIRVRRDMGCRGSAVEDDDERDTSQQRLSRGKWRRRLSRFNHHPRPDWTAEPFDDGSAPDTGAPAFDSGRSNLLVVSNGRSGSRRRCRLRAGHRELGHPVVRPPPQRGHSRVLSLLLPMAPPGGCVYGVTAGRISTVRPGCVSDFAGGGRTGGRARPRLNRVQTAVGAAASPVCLLYTSPSP